MAYQNLYYTQFTPPNLVESEEQKKKKKEEEQKAILERIRTNRLYLKKVKKDCALESFKDLQKLQLFLFEVMVEDLEVNITSDLNLLSENKDRSYVTARVQFLNSPYLEICEKDIEPDGPKQPDVQTDLWKAVGQGGLTNTYYTGGPTPSNTPATSGTAIATPSPTTFNPPSVFGPPTQTEFPKEEKMKVKWKKTSGKSCLFSLTPLQVVQDLEKYPVVMQVVRRLTPEKDKMASKTEVDKPKLDQTPSKTKVAGIQQSKEDLRKSKKDKLTDQEGNKAKLAEAIKAAEYEPLGYACIKLPEEFSLSVLQACKEGVLLPISNVHRETCDLENVFGSKKGTVSVYIRLSSFGPAIVTNFHTVGRETKYLFKPSSIVDNFQPVTKVRVSKLDDLKPLLAEEDKAIGISVLKTEDNTFKHPVMWGCGHLDCGCTFEGECFFPSDPESLYTEMSPQQLKLPITSQLSLCRDYIQPNSFKSMNKFKTAGNICNWHNLVTKEIQNSPGETCGCISSKNKEGVKRDSREKAYKRKPQGLCTCSLSPDIMFLAGGDKSTMNNNDLKNTHLGLCNCIAGTEKRPIDLYKFNRDSNKDEKKETCCKCCKCGLSKKRQTKKSSSSEKVLVGYCGWPSPRSLVKKDPFGWDDQESKKLNKLLEDADKLVENKRKSTPKDKKKNCGCLPTDKSKSSLEKKKSKKRKCECKRPRGLIKPLSSSSDLSSDSDQPLFKMNQLGKDLPAIPGFGMKSMKMEDCGCACPNLKLALEHNTLFPL